MKNKYTQFNHFKETYFAYVKFKEAFTYFTKNITLQIRRLIKDAKQTMNPDLQDFLENIIIETNRLKEELKFSEPAIEFEEINLIRYQLLKKHEQEIKIWFSYLISNKFSKALRKLNSKYVEKVLSIIQQALAEHPIEKLNLFINALQNELNNASFEVRKQRTDRIDDDTVNKAFSLLNEIKNMENIALLSTKDRMQLTKIINDATSAIKPKSIKTNSLNIKKRIQDDRKLFITLKDKINIRMNVWEIQINKLMKDLDTIKQTACVKKYYAPLKVLRKLEHDIKTIEYDPQSTDYTIKMLEIELHKIRKTIRLHLGKQK